MYRPDPIMCLYHKIDDLVYDHYYELSDTIKHEADAMLSCISRTAPALDDMSIGTAISIIRRLLKEVNSDD